MQILLVHQNFPGQFVHICEALLNSTNHALTAFTMNGYVSNNSRLSVVSYKASKASGTDIHPWAKETEAKIIRGEAAMRAAMALKEKGYTPDIILAHPGWGESLFLKHVWPDSKIILYCEFFYHTKGADVGFDPEFPSKDIAQLCTVQLKNANNLLNMEIADVGISPTEWQRSTFPEPFRSKIQVIHDGIDTTTIKPDHNVQIKINGKNLNPDDEVITFVNRNMEPYRGYHIFMRALPEILKSRPKARVLIIGGDGVSYGSAPPKGLTWKNIYLNEVAEHLDEGRVHFLGSLNYQDYLKVIQRSDVHVYLTYPFVLSWSLLEAMAMECAIVGSNTAPLLEVIKTGKNGVLVDFFNPKSLSNAVIELLEDPTLRLKLRSEARKTVVEKYDLKTVCLPKLMNLIEHL
jgi:glycosyltransferase involved in cell wall biosynthesis